ncbi:MAG: hypothetical protein PWQ88_649 [Candidatus Methanomethylophilaceae archaeon]|nr:hypothetical protein [Candidatus Methanomethylophilaceae archaeon]MDI3542260.1 hypothetical protein [Candidatus Methanomethylophilaceae archaeon]
MQGSILCPSCGEYLILDLDLKAVQRISLIAKMPALIPGIFNIFGLGHLIIGKYLRAFILLLISLVLRVVNRMLVLSGTFPYVDLMFLSVSLIVFVYQLWDVYTITYGWTAKR